MNKQTFGQLAKGDSFETVGGVQLIKASHGYDGQAERSDGSLCWIAGHWDVYNVNS